MSDDGRSSGDPSGLEPGEPRSFGGGRYVVRRRLGAGNFATVYLAFDERLDVPVAVKLLSDRWSWEPEVRGRFVQEARLLRSLNAPHVVQIRDIAETDDGRPYLVMDYATRGTLEQRMVELAQRDARPGTEELRRIGRAMADALGFLHSRRIAHRDIKPSNVLITADSERWASPEVRLLRPDERLVLGDLGLAKDLRFDSGITVGVGTAGYMAPEQALAGAKIDTRSDIYAASAVFAQIASGEAPDPLRRTSGGIVMSGRPLPGTIAPPLAAAILHGLETDPADRPATIEEWFAGIEAALDEMSRPVAVEPSPSPSTVAAPDRRRVGALVAAGALAIAIGVGSVLALTGDDSDGDTGGVTTATSTSTTVGATSTTTATTSVGTTTPPTTATLDPTVPLIGDVRILGPTEFEVGQRVFFSVDAPADAARGTWSLPGFTLGDASWAPEQTFGVQPDAIGTFMLTIDVFDAEGGVTGTDSHTFTVVPTSG